MKKEYPIKRNGYYYLGDPIEKYISVTKILNDVIAKPNLLYWYAKESGKIALEEPWLTDKEVLSKLQMKVKETQNRGKYIHSLAENMPNINGLIRIGDNQYDGYVEALKSFWNDWSPEIIQTEILLSSKEKKIAGRCDQISRIKGELWILDFKTGKDIYKEVELQLAAYKKMFNETTVSEEEIINNVGVVLLESNGGYVFKKTNGDFNIFIKILDIWKWMKQKGEVE